MEAQTISSRPQMRLEQHAVDLLELDGFGSVAHGLRQACDAEVSRMSEHALGRAHDECERVGCEDLVQARRGRARMSSLTPRTIDMNATLSSTVPRRRVGTLQVEV